MFYQFFAPNGAAKNLKPLLIDNNQNNVCDTSFSHGNEFLFDSFQNKEIGHSGVFASVNNDKTINIVGYAKETAVLNIGDAILQKGDYVFKGFCGQKKNTVALQIWEIDNNEFATKILAPQIGFYENSQFSIDKETRIRIRIIVYKEANIDAICYPLIVKKNNNYLDLMGISNFSNGILFSTISSGILCVNGKSNKTFFYNLYDFTIEPGEYVLYGLNNVNKNTIAIQVWSLDENNNTEKLLCPHLGPTPYVSFTINDTIRIRIRFLVYDNETIHLICFPSLICKEKYPRFSGNLINFFNIDGEIGNSNVWIRSNKRDIFISGTPANTCVRIFGTATLYPGYYRYGGLSGMQKGTLAFQAWSLDSEGNIIETVCPQIGEGENNISYFMIKKITTIMLRVIVYASSVCLNVSCSPYVELVDTYECDFESISSIESQANILIMESGHDDYKIYKSIDGGYFNFLARTENDYFVDVDITEDKQYSYYYVADTTIKSKIREVGFNARNTSCVACLMYHYFMTTVDLENGGLSNSFVYVNEFESDLRYLSENNYETIFCSELVSFLKGEINLPEKCIMIVIDDGHYSVYKYAMPLLEKYNCKANVTIIGEKVENSVYRTEIPQNNYWMNSEEIAELYNSGYFEVGSHTYYLHNNNGRNGAHKEENETDEEYFSVLLNDCNNNNSLIEESIGKKPTFFAWPYNNPSLSGVFFMNETFNYDLFFVGDANYWDYTKTRTNYFVQNTYSSIPWHLVRRASRRTGEDFSTLLSDIFENKNPQY